MIKDGLVYECLDNRKDMPRSMAGVTMLAAIPGGFEIWNVNGYSERIQFDDDDQLDEMNGVSTFLMPEGKIDFVPLDLPNFQKMGGPKSLGTPAFKDTRALQDFFRAKIENA